MEELDGGDVMLTRPQTHTILGSKSQRGLTQLALDVLFSSLETNMVESHDLLTITDSLQACDASEASLVSASSFLDAVFEPQYATRSRAATPMIVRQSPPKLKKSSLKPAPATQRESYLPPSPVYAGGKNKQKQQAVLPGTFPESETPPPRESSPQSVRLVSEKQETLRLKER
jgi:hypothetical protein